MSAAFRPLQANPLLPLALGAIAGILLADQTNPPLWFFAAAIPLCFIASLQSMRSPRGRTISGAALFALSMATFGLHHDLTVRKQQLFPLAGALQNNRTLSVVAEGFVRDDPAPLNAGNRHRFTLQLDSITHRGLRFRTPHRLRVSLPGIAPRPGDCLVLEGFLRGLPEARNPGQFALRPFLERSGIAGDLFVSKPAHAQLVAARSGSRLLAFAAASRRWIETTITRDLTDSKDVSAVLAAMVLGDKSNTPAEIEEGFRHAGALHIFAVSGLHVGIFATVLWLALRVLGMNRSQAAYIMIPCLLFYALVTGLRPSAVRAAIMAGIFLGGFALQRPPRLLNSLAGAALVILSCNTQQLFLPGFQLSFAVLVSIALFAGPLQKPLRKCVQPDPFLPRSLIPPWRKPVTWAGNYVTGLAAVSVTAWFGSLPLVLWHFQLITPVALIANLVLVPLAFVVLFIAALSMLSAAGGMVAASVAFNNANWLTAKLLLFCSTLFASLPGGHFYVQHPAHRQTAPCRVTVLDTGLGGAAQCISHSNPALNLLIDTAGPDSVYEVLLPYLRFRNLTRVDALFITHGDAQHLGGAVPLLESVSVNSIMGSLSHSRSPYRQPFFAATRALGAEPPADLLAGTRLSFKPETPVSLEILYPPPEIAADARTADDQCLALRLHAYGWRILFMSDNGFLAEKWLLAQHPAIDLRSDILIKGRHRSDFSGLPEFLNAVEPDAIICTQTRFPDTEQIPARWRDLVAAKGIRLFDQSRTGAVEVDCHNDRLVIRSYLTDQHLTIPASPPTP